MNEAIQSGTITIEQTDGVNVFDIVTRTVLDNETIHQGYAPDRCRSFCQGHCGRAQDGDRQGHDLPHRGQRPSAARSVRLVDTRNHCFVHPSYHTSGLATRFGTEFTVKSQLDVIDYYIGEDDDVLEDMRFITLESNTGHTVVVWCFKHHKLGRIIKKLKKGPDFEMIDNHPLFLMGGSSVSPSYESADVDEAIRHPSLAGLDPKTSCFVTYAQLKFEMTEQEVGHWRNMGNAVHYYWKYFV